VLLNKEADRTCLTFTRWTVLTRLCSQLVKISLYCCGLSVQWHQVNLFV